MVRASSVEDGYTGLMNRIVRLAAGLSILLTAPGFAPYQAAAQTMAARAGAAAPGASASAAGSAGAAVVPNLSLPAANLAAPGLASPLTTASVFKPVAVMGVYAAPAPANDGVRAAAVLPVQPAAMPVVAAAAAVPVNAAVFSLSESASRVQAAASPGAATTPEAELGVLFEGASVRRSALGEAVLAAASSESDPNRLESSSAREPAKGPRWVGRLQRIPDGDPANPRTSLKRTFSVGFLAAVVPIAITMITVAIAAALGHELHPNYKGPVGDALPSLLQAIGIWIGAAIMAPVSEEAIFRGGIQGRLAKLTKKLRLGDFVVPALITSTFFVALHETSDPVLFATRMVHALILSYVYKKEGILAAMAAHGFFNGLLALTVVFTALGLPVLSLAVLPVAGYYSWRSWKVIKEQRPLIASGALKPMPMSGLVSLIFAALLTLGYVMLMPNVFWLVGAVILGIHGLMKIKNNS